MVYKMLRYRGYKNITIRSNEWATRVSEFFPSGTVNYETLIII